MAIITISRGTFSGGKALAECLAEQLDCECVSREILTEAARTYGVSAEALAAAMEKAPRLLDRLGRARDRYVAFVRAALCERAARGALVYHGHAGHLLLSPISHVLRVRVVAPMGMRIAAAREQLGLGEHGAIAYIEKVDRERERWTRFLYHVEWGDPAHYDMVVNLEKVDIPSACSTLRHMAGQPAFAVTPGSQAALRNLALHSRIAAVLAADPVTASADIDILVEGDAVTLQGWVPSQHIADAVPRLVETVDGVSAVHSEIGVNPGFLG